MTLPQASPTRREPLVRVVDMRTVVFSVVLVLGTTAGHLELGRPLPCQRLCKQVLQHAAAQLPAPSTGTKLAAR